MKIGILGSGDVGLKLVDSFIENKHLVKIGSRDPNQEKLTEWMAKQDYLPKRCGFQNDNSINSIKEI